MYKIIISQVKLAFNICNISFQIGNFDYLSENEGVFLETPGISCGGAGRNIEEAQEPAIVPLGESSF
ncbi:MAG: hypothetical protein BRD50_02765 [Bacteroidetes bacterium SW_11_45_7]|nr:MAG: hypothetical protein BRD50_02765 [Bacteroidetes bacterium SW_11_45_7]